MANYRRIFADEYSYFLTVVTYQRNPILIDNIDLLRQSIAFSKSKYDYTIEAVVILPDHFHIMIHPQNPTDYPEIIRAIKSHLSRHCEPKYYEHLLQSHSRNQRSFKPIWQKRFYEHTIRDEKDFRLHLDYIHYNPIKHGVTTQVKKWQYSSFDKYVKMGWYDANWGDFDESINFE